MRMYHGPHRQPPGAGQGPDPLLVLGPDLEVVVDHRHLAVEEEAGVGGVALEQVEQAVEQVAPAAAGSVWNGSYHSRSQWVWGTMAIRRGDISSGYASGPRFRDPAGCRIR